MTSAPAVIGPPSSTAASTVRAHGQPEPGLHLGGAGGVEDDVVDAPVAGDAGQTALGDDDDQRDRDARGADDPAQRLGHRELAAGVDDDDVGLGGVDQGGGLRGQDANMV